MQDQNFQAALELVYATFGRNRPSGEVIQAIRSRVDHIPDEAVPWIVGRICDEATIPQNMGRAFAHGWDAWQMANPQRIAKEICRAECDNGFRHCWAQAGDEKWRHFVSLCPVCRRSEIPIPSTRELEARGVVLMPPGYHGGPLGFDQDKGFFALSQRDVQPENGRKMRWIAESMPDMRQDTRRLENLTPNEFDDAMGW